MRFRLVAGAVLLAALPSSALFAGAANAEEPAAPPAPSLHRDPRGLQGLSPFWEAVKQGDDAVATGHLETARTAYEDAIEKEPDNPLGHYRLGQFEMLKGNLAQAEAAYQSAVRLSADKPVLRAKAMFALADLHERKRAVTEATVAWSAYETYAGANRMPGMYPLVAAERKQRMQTYTELVAEYAAVKDRIKKRLEEAEKRSAESARAPGNR